MSIRHFRGSPYAAGEGVECQGRPLHALNTDYSYSITDFRRLVPVGCGILRNQLGRSALSPRPAVSEGNLAHGGPYRLGSGAGCLRDNCELLACLGGEASKELSSRVHHGVATMICQRPLIIDKADLRQAK